MISGYISTKLIARSPIDELIKEDIQKEIQKDSSNPLNYISVSFTTPAFNAFTIDRNVFSYSYNNILKEIEINSIPEIENNSINENYRIKKEYIDMINLGETLMKIEEEEKKNKPKRIFNNNDFDVDNSYNFPQPIKMKSEKSKKDEEISKFLSECPESNLAEAQFFLNAASNVQDAVNFYKDSKGK